MWFAGVRKAKRRRPREHLRTELKTTSKGALDYAWKNVRQSKDTTLPPGELPWHRMPTKNTAVHPTERRRPKTTTQKPAEDKTEGDEQTPPCT